MVRIAIGGIYHETNTFVAGTTSLADFRAYQFAVKAEMLAYQGTRSEIGGFLDGCEARSWEPTLSIFAAAVPGGPVDNDAFEVIVAHLLDGLVAGQRPDGVLLCLHGAMATTKFADADGEVIRRMVEVLVLCGHVGRGKGPCMFRKVEQDFRTGVYGMARQHSNRARQGSPQRARVDGSIRLVQRRIHRRSFIKLKT
jgi:hypothetical protein